MQRALLLLAIGLLACSAAEAQDQNNLAAVKPIVVDPLDLRQPVPDPQAELTQKYDGKLVQFTGVLHTSGTDASKKKWSELQTEVPLPGASARAAKGAKAKTERVAVRVYFQGGEKSLQPQQLRSPLTVEGTGEILVDGTLVIHDAKIIKNAAGSKR